ncbi:SpoIIE family protein phosphatase [Sphaerisporangium sp. NPDC005288]|uniref:SpoIIE family protein phosphatase n=1 Tax=Sphaerisporangium sp. NPDC005288 TaxID=3155114 RepID=UPI0033B321B6
MTGSGMVVRDAREDGPVEIPGDLAAALHPAVCEAADRLNAVAAAVYLLTADGAELKAAMIGGSPPSVFTLPGRMALDAPYASARAVSDGMVAVLADPDPRADDRSEGTPYPYTVAAAPLWAGEHRFGALTVLRPEDRGGYADEDRAALRTIGDRLAVVLDALAARRGPITPGHLPVLVPVFDTARAQPYPANAGEAAPGAGSPAGSAGLAVWGVPGVPGSAGLSLMYPLQRLADMLNRATTMDHVVGAARFCVMSPFHARAMVLASVGDGRLWVIGHSGDSSDLVHELHGSGLHAHTPAAQAVAGRALFVSGDPDRPAAEGLDHEMYAAAYLPLIGSRHVIDVPFTGSDHVVGVCCLSFGGPRRFAPEERAVLTMMAGRLGSAVERIELTRKRQAYAECLQKRLLPPVLPNVPRLTTTARYQPAAATYEVGGDWYDLIESPDERVVLVIGDVEGHTLESAAVMGQLRSALAAYATEGHGPAALLERTGALLSRLGTDLLATCCVVALDTADGHAEVALAGHPAPLLRCSDGVVRTLTAPANVPLGVAAPTPYRAREHTLTAGSVLMLYSDGLVDPRVEDPGDGAAATFRSAALEAGADLEKLADRLLTEAPDPRRRRDDVALLLARYEGAEDVPRTGHLHIEARDLRGAKEVRGLVHDLLCQWGLTEVSEDLQLVTSEVVTNALIHAGTDVDVRLRAFADRVRLEVRDSDSDPPVPSPFSLSEEGSAEAEHGRGLFLVDALASAWNSSPSGRGKTVWLEIAIPAS